MAAPENAPAHPVPGELPPETAKILGAAPLAEGAPRAYRWFEWAEEITDMVSPYWQAEAVENLQLLLDDAPPDQTEPARLELQKLMQHGSPFRPLNANSKGPANLTDVEHVMLSRLSGHGLRPWEKMLPLARVLEVYGPKLKPGTRPTSGVVTAVKKLVDRALKDGVYVQEQQEPTTTPKAQAVPIRMVREMVEVALPREPRVIEKASGVVAVSETAIIAEEPEATRTETGPAAQAPVPASLKPENASTDGAMDASDIAALFGVKAKAVRQAIDALNKNSGLAVHGFVRRRSNGQQTRHFHEQELERIIRALEDRLQ